MSAASLPSVRGWCPGVLHPMATGDGLLVRVHPQAGRLTAMQLRAVSRAAHSCGNGMVEVSSRANLQIRGVTDAAHPRLVRLLDEVGLAEAPGAGPYRPCIVSPLAGLDPDEAFDSFAVASAVESALGADDALAPLPAKFGVVVDGGGRFALDDVSADIRVVPGPRSETVLTGIPDPAGWRWFGPSPLRDAVSAVHALASALAVVLRDTPGRRMRDVGEAVLARLSLPPAAPPPAPRSCRAPPVGVLPCGNTCAILLGLPFGRCDADDIATMADWADSFGTGEVRTAPWRALAIVGVRPERAQALLAKAAEAGLVVKPEDPRVAISACPGSPACASGQATTLKDAARLAPLLDRLPAGATVHVSGCAKGCARRTPADLTLVGDAGQYRVVLSGRPTDPDIARLPFDAILARLAAGKLAIEEPA